MRQAVTTTIVGLSLVLSPVAPASGGLTDAEGTIAQARRLIEAKDYSPATVLLEDLLPEAQAKDRPTILELLKQSYLALAREAQAAGHDRDAAYYRDNVAIIDRCRVPAAPARSTEEKPRKPAAPQPPMGQTKTSDGTAGAPYHPLARNVSLVDSAQDSHPEPLPTPTPLPEPAKLPMPRPFPQLPNELASTNSPASSRNALPSIPPLKTNDPGRDQGDTPGVVARAAGVPDSHGASLPSAHAGAVEPGDPQPTTAGSSLSDGDRLFAAGRYDDAGRCYAALARQHRLPAHRKEHWAYCRMVEVARRINARPKSAREWNEIEAEIVGIQRLTPNIWYGEYLRNKVAEVRRGGRRAPTQSENLVVRGSAPDESRSQQEPEPRRFPRLLGKSRTASPSQPQASNAQAASSAGLPLNLPGPSQPSEGASPPKSGDGFDLDSTGGHAADRSQPPSAANARRADEAENEKAATSGIAWQVLETPNFRVYHRDASLAEAAGRAAESVRAAQAKRWGSPALERPWTPPCDLYLYPSGKVFARETNQPENSPGFSTMACKGNRVVARRTNLRADHPQLLTAILPHEVTHVVLADIFTVEQVPRWADEGIAVLAEPRAEQQIRAAELQEPLEAGRVFELSKLMAMDYPEAKDWSLYYAQSVSLTRFLVEQGPPEQFVRFVRNSQRDGIEVALRDSYRIGGFAELQERWMEHARRQCTPLKEARREPDSQPPAAEVK